MWRYAHVLAQMPTDISAWAVYGPLGMFCFVLIGVAWFFIRREAARADRWEAIALKAIEANQSALKSTDSASLSVAVVEDLLRLAIEREGKRER